MPKSIWSNYGSSLKVGWMKSLWRRVFLPFFPQNSAKCYKMHSKSLSQTMFDQALWRITWRSSVCKLVRVQGVLLHIRIRECEHNGNNEREKVKVKHLSLFGSRLRPAQTEPIAWLSGKALQGWLVKWHIVSTAFRPFNAWGNLTFLTIDFLFSFDSH